jgi:antitoxin component of MazEF toxin-antitoxin module
MIKTITKVGNSQGLIFDTALMELTGLKPGDQVNVTIHPGGSVMVTPVKPAVVASEARASAKKLIVRNKKLFKRLA